MLAEWDDSEGGGYGEGGDDAPWSMPGGGARSRGASVQNPQHSLSAAARAVEQAARPTHGTATTGAAPHKSPVAEFLLFVKKLESQGDTTHSSSSGGGGRESRGTMTN